LLLSVDKLACCFFKNQFLKSSLALQCLLFVAAVFGGQCEFVCLLAGFGAGHSNFFLLQNSFYIFKLHSFFNSWLSKFYLLQLKTLPQRLTGGFVQGWQDVVLPKQQ
jgi:hypothetical protein